MYEWSNEAMVVDQGFSRRSWTKDDHCVDAILPRYPRPGLPRHVSRALQDRVFSRLALEYPPRADGGSLGTGQGAALHGSKFATGPNAGASAAGGQPAKPMDEKARKARRRTVAIMLKTLGTTRSNSLLITKGAFAQMAGDEHAETRPAADDDNLEDTNEAVDDETIRLVVDSQGDAQVLEIGEDIVFVCYYENSGAEGLRNLLGPDGTTFCSIGCVVRDSNSQQLYRPNALEIQTAASNIASEDAVLELLKLQAGDGIESIKLVPPTEISDGAQASAVVTFRSSQFCLEVFQRIASTRTPALSVSYIPLDPKESRMHSTLVRFLNCPVTRLCQTLTSVHKSGASNEPGASYEAGAQRGVTSVAASSARAASSGRGGKSEASGLDSQDATSLGAPTSVTSPSIRSGDHAALGGVGGGSSVGAPASVPGTGAPGLRGKTPGQGSHGASGKKDHAKRSPEDPNPHIVTRANGEQISVRGVAPLNRAGNKKSNQAEFQIKVDAILKEEDFRTSIMVRNIPNKYTQKMVLEEINELFANTYDFFYLPIDFQNKCNIGYAFINFVDARTIVRFYKHFHDRRWSHFNSGKICAIAYARIQGRDALVSRFENSSVMEMDRDCRPVVFDTVPQPGAAMFTPAPPAPPGYFQSGQMHAPMQFGREPMIPHTAGVNGAAMSPNMQSMGHMGANVMGQSMMGQSGVSPGQPMHYMPNGVYYQPPPQ